MSKKNPIVKVWIIRKNDSDTYVIGFTRKLGKYAIRFYSDVSQARADRINKATIFSNRYTQDAGFKNAHWHGKAFNLDTPKPKPLTVYFVQVGMDGYLPDSVSAYPTLAQAIRAAKEEKAFELDQAAWGNYPCKVSGNIRSDWNYDIDRGEGYFHSIRIESEPVESVMQDSFPLETIKTRRGLELFCEYYNENN